MDTQSHRLRRLALARGLRASPAEAAAAGAVEMATAILGEVTQMKKTKAAAAAGDEDPIHAMLELGVFLLASLVKDARSATLPKLGGADFQEAARHVWDNKQDHPQIIAALCYVLQALSLKLTKWQVQLSDGGEWSDLAAEQQLALRKATEKGEKVVHFRARGFPYEIDLKEMTQKNLKTGTSRTIQEVEVSIGALAGDAGGEEEVEAEKPYKWQVSNGKGGWWDFPEDVDTKLKEARAAGISVVKCTIRGQHYEVDIVNMHQKNCKVGTRREIRTLEL
ncbi:unnamed protein product [Symbiodinium natans]|uniref:WWE domain-containing protein n=1 Tax=Symbiodinium natans TaxID=878477 RepID=A0A812M0B1_9DINO|nr:unnamed protein product [Symbiodinium natans]